MPEPEPGKSPPRRRFGRTRRFLTILAALALLLFIVFLVTGPGARLDAWARARLRVELADALNRPVSVAVVHISPLSGSFEARDVVVGETPPGTGRVLEVPAVSGTVSVMGLLRGRVDIQEIRIERPIVRVSRSGGRWEGPFPAPAQPKPSLLPARPKSPLKLILRRLEIVDGVAAFEDRTLPLWLKGEEVSLEWDGDESGNGRGRLDSPRLSGGSADLTQSGEAHLEGRLTGSKAETSGRLAWGAGSVAFDASAALGESEGVAPSGELHARLRLEERADAPVLAKLFKLDVPVEGKLEGSAVLRFGGGTWSADGRLHAETVRVEDVRVSSLDANVRARPDAIEVSDLSIQTMGGRVLGSARFDPRPGGELSATVTGEDLPLNRVLSLIGLESPLEGRGSLSGEISGKPGEPDTLRAAAAVKVGKGKGPVAAGHYTVEGEGELHLAGRTVTFLSPRASTGATTTSLRIVKPLGEGPLTLGIDATTGSLADASALVEAFLVRQDEPIALPWRSAKLSGSGRISGEMIFQHGHPARGSLGFSFDQFAYERIGADSVSGLATAEGEAFTLTTTTAFKQGGTLAIDARFPEGHTGVSRITGRFDRWPIDDALARAGAPGSPSARVTGRAEFRPGPEGASGEADVAIADARAGSDVFPTGSLLASIQGSRVHIQSLALDGPAAHLWTSGVYDVSTGGLAGKLEGRDVDARVTSEWLHGLPLDGHADVTLEIDALERAASWTLAIAPKKDLALGGHSLSELSFSAEGDHSEARVRGALDAHAQFNARIDLAAPHLGQGKVDLVDVPFATLVAFARPDLAPGVGGEIGGEIFWSGPLDDTSALEANAVLPLVHIAVGSESLSPATPARLSLSGGVVSFDSVELTSDSSRVTLTGHYPLDPARPFDLNLHAQVDMSALSVFIPEIVSSGHLDVTLRAGGSRENPDLAGSATLDDGRLRVLGFPLAAEQLRLRARIDSKAIVADEISASAGGGEVRGRGRVDLNGLAAEAFQLEGHATAVSLALPDGFRGLYSGTLRWEGRKGAAPSLTGKLDLLRGLWSGNFNLDKLSFGARSRAPLVEAPAPTSGVATTTLDLQIHADDNVWCRNDLGTMEGRADLTVSGTVARPRVSGRYEGFEGGEMRFRGVRYQVTQAIVSFPAGSRFNAAFDVHAETRVRDHDVRMHLWGDMAKVEYDLSSLPPLPQQEILALLLTGTLATDENLASGPATPNLGTPRDIVAGQLGSIVGTPLESWLRVEEIRIDTYHTQGTVDPTTRVTIGKRLSPRIFVRTSVPLNSTQESSYEAEFQASRKVRLVAERTDLGAAGAEVRYTTRFRSPALAARAPAEDLSAAKHVKKIAEIRFSGEAGYEPARLRRITRLRVGKVFTRRALITGTDRLKKRFVKDKFLQASVRGSVRDLGGDQVIVEYTIDRGPKVAVSIEGAGVQTEKIRKGLDALWLESSFAEVAIDEAKDLVRTTLQEEGYYACTVKTRVTQGASVKKVVFIVDPGEKVRVESVTVKGASALSESEIRRQILTGSESLFGRDTVKPETLAADATSILTLYRSHGYLQARVEPEVSLTTDGRRARIVMLIDEGDLSTLRSVTIEGNHEIPSARIEEEIRSRKGEPFLASTVGTDLDRIRILYDAEGYPDARVEDETRSENNDIDLTYRIVEGGRKTVRKIVVEGNVITKESVIQREVDLETGTPISQARIQEIQSRLMKTGLFSDVSISWEDIPGKNTGQVLKIHVRENDNLFLSVGAGYDTANGPKGTLELADPNLWGYGRYAGLSVIYGSELKRGQITFKEPRLFQWPVNAVVSTFYENWNRESFSERLLGASIGLDHKTKGHVTHRVSWGGSLSEVYNLTISESDFRREEPRLDLGRVRLANVGYAIIRDTRDDLLNTTRGTYASADLRVFARPVGSEQNFAQLFLQGSLHKPLPLGLNWGTSVRVGLSARYDSRVPLPLQSAYFAGGDTTVRGFPRDRLGYVATAEVDERKNGVDLNGDGTLGLITVNTGTLDRDTLSPLGGEALVVVNNELSHVIFKSFSGVVFWDSGDVFPRPADIRLGNFRNTLGAGLHVQTPIGPLRLEYAWKLDRIKGVVQSNGARNKESSGELVISIGQSF